MRPGQLDPDHIPGLDFFAMQAELSQILDRQVEKWTFLTQRRKGAETQRKRYPLKK
jgi:hypothetical protein